jgi:hypothetical protein
MHWDAATRAVGPTLGTFDCSFVSVLGQFSSSLSSSDVGGRDLNCLQLNVLSNLVPYTDLTGPGVPVSFPAGSGRTFVVLGMMANQGGGCVGKSISQLFSGGTPSLYVLGKSAPIDVFQNTSIHIADTYVASATTDLVAACPGAGASSLPLVLAYEGNSGVLNSATVGFTDTLSGALPPTSASLTPMAAIAANLAGFNGNNSASGYHERVDALFDLGGINPATVTHLVVTANGLGGTTGARGTPGGFTGSPTAWQMAVYNATGNKWGAAIIPDAGGTASFNATSAMSPYAVTEGGHPYLHVTFRANDYTSTASSAIVINSISASLGP